MNPFQYLIPSRSLPVLNDFQSGAGQGEKGTAAVLNLTSLKKGFRR